MTRRHPFGIVLTGGSGFIGRHVRACATASGIPVTLLSRSPLSRESNEELVLVDELHDADWPTIGRRFAEWALLHLAWGGLPNYESSRHLGLELPRQIAALRAAIKSHPARLVVSGTCFEYGNLTGSICESHPCQPTTAYGESKRRLLDECLGWMQNGDVGLVWFRIFYPYGPGQRKDSLFGQLQTAAAIPGSTVLLQQPSRRSDFLPVSEVARDLVAAAVSGAACSILNLGSGFPRTVAAHALQLIVENAWNVNLATSSADRNDGCSGMWADVTHLKLWRDHIGGEHRLGGHLC